MYHEGRSINSRTARFFVRKDKNCSMYCSCDIYCVLHIPWVIITPSLRTSLLFKISTDDVGMQQKRRIIIKFLVAEGVPSTEVYYRLVAVFKDDCFFLIHVYLSGVLIFANGWQHVTSSPKKFRVQPWVGKIMSCVFWDSQRLILVDFVPHGITLNADY